MELWPILSPGTRGNGMLLERLSPGWGLQVRLAGPVGVSAVRTTEAELPPAGVVQRQDQFSPCTTNLAAAAQVREGEVGQDDPPQLHGEVPHLHGSRDTWKQAATRTRR